MKKCATCLIEKDESEFYKCNTSKDGYRASCKICRNISQKKCDEKNKEKRIETKRIWEVKNKEKLSLKRKEWKKRNRDKVLENGRIYGRKRYANNLEREQQRCRNWRKNNQETYLKSNRKSCKKRYLNNTGYYLEQSKKWRIEHPERVKEIARENRKISAAKYPEKERARMFVAMAIKTGLLIRPKNCSKCLCEGRIEGHHTDYNKPLEVVWLCRKCHRKIHKELKLSNSINEEK